MDYKIILTNIGAAKISQFQAENKNITLSYIAFGDGEDIEPDKAATSLIREVYRSDITSIKRHPSDHSVFIAEGYIPASVNGFWIREIGIYDIDNALIAIGNYPSTYKEDESFGAAVDLRVNLMMKVSSSNNFTFVLDPSVVMASREYVDDVKTDLQKDIEDKNTEVKEDIDSINSILSSLGQNKADKDDIDRDFVMSIAFTNSDGELKQQIKTLNPLTENEDEIVSVVPLADEDKDGAMSKHDVQAIRQNTSRIAALEGASKRYPVYLGTAELTQEEYQSSFESAANVPSGTTPPDGATLINLDNNHAITYFANKSNDKWVDRGVDTITQADNNGTMGGIVGSLDDGQIYIETDGKGSVNGWNTLKSAIVSNANALNNKEDKIKNAPAKTTLVDNDAVAISDSQNANNTKRITWTNVKNVLKSYFDTIYNKVTKTSELVNDSGFGKAFVCSSSTAVGTAVKVVTGLPDGYVPTGGDMLLFTLANGNNVSTPKIKIGTTEYFIRNKGINLTAADYYTIPANQMVILVFDGTYFHIPFNGDWVDTDTPQAYNLRFGSSCYTTGVEITKYKVCAVGIDGKIYPLYVGDITENTKTKATQVFDLNTPMFIHTGQTTAAAGVSTGTIFYYSFYLNSATNTFYWHNGEVDTALTTYYVKAEPNSTGDGWTFLGIAKEIEKTDQPNVIYRPIVTTGLNAITQMFDMKESIWYRWNNNTKRVELFTNSESSGNRAYFAETNTPINTALKVVDGLSNDYNPKKGDVLKVYMPNGNNVVTPKFSINGIEYPLTYKQANLTASANYTIPAKQIIEVTYDGARWEFSYNPDWVDTNVTWDSNFNTNTLILGENITRYKLAAKALDGKIYMLSSGDTAEPAKVQSDRIFSIDTIIFFNTLSGTQNAGNKAPAQYYYNFYYNNANNAYWHNGITGTNRTIYLVGTIESGGFKLDQTNPTSWYTTAVPTSEDGKVYRPLGYVGDNTDIIVYHNTPQYYEYKNGMFQPYSNGGTSTRVVNNLTSTSTTEALSAAQGKVLNDTKLDKAGGTMTGVLKFRTANLAAEREPLRFYKGNANGDGVVLQAEGMTVAASGEAGTALMNLVGDGVSPDVGSLTPESENLIFISDQNVFLETNAQTIANRKVLKFGSDGVILPFKNKEFTIGATGNRFNNAYVYNLDSENTIRSTANTASYINGFKGVNAVINSDVAKGSYVSLWSYKANEGNFTISGYQNQLEVGFATNAVIDAGTNATSKRLILLNKDGHSTFPGTVSAARFAGQFGEEYTISPTGIGLFVSVAGKESVAEIMEQRNKYIVMGNMCSLTVYMAVMFNAPQHGENQVYFLIDATLPQAIGNVIAKPIATYKVNATYGDSYTTDNDCTVTGIGSDLSATLMFNKYKIASIGERLAYINLTINWVRQ